MVVLRLVITQLEVTSAPVPLASSYRVIDMDVMVIHSLESTSYTQLIYYVM